LLKDQTKSFRRDFWRRVVVDVHQRTPRVDVASPCRNAIQVPSVASDQCQSGQAPTNNGLASAYNVSCVCIAGHRGRNVPTFFPSYAEDHPGLAPVFSRTNHACFCMLLPAPDVVLTNPRRPTLFTPQLACRVYMQ